MLSWLWTGNSKSSAIFRLPFVWRAHEVYAWISWILLWIQSYISCRFFTHFSSLSFKKRFVFWSIWQVWALKFMHIPTQNTSPTCIASIISFNSPKMIQKMKYPHPNHSTEYTEASTFPRRLLGQIDLFHQKMVQLGDLRTAIPFLLA